MANNPNTKLAPKETTNPISCSYYGTEKQLQETIARLTVSHPTLRFAYAVHKADNDDTKDHIHLLIKTLADKISNTDKIREFFKHEYDDSYYISKFITTKVNALADWELYVRHDAKYLEYKGQTRNIHYSEDITQGSPDFVNELRELASEYWKRQEERNNDSDFAVITRLVEQGCDNFEIIKQLQGVRCDNLNSVWLGIEKVRSNCSNIEAIKNQGVVDYFYNCGLVEALSQHPCVVSPTTSLKFRRLTAEICHRFIEVCIQKAIGMDELEYILNGEITE